MAASGSASGPLARVDHLTKRFGRVTALDDVSLEVPAGGIVGLIGPNGAGKTTLFECLAGLLPVDQGTVQAPALFYVPDGIAPWPAQPVRWALDFANGFFDGDRTRQREVIDRLALTPFLDRPFGVLSKGQRKRALLAIGLLTPQPLLLIDEPFDGLDLRQTRDVSAALVDHAAQGRTLFLSIHQIADAERICDSFVLLSGGRVVGSGSLDDLSGRLTNQSPDGAMARSRDLEEVFLALT